MRLSTPNASRHSLPFAFIQQSKIIGAQDAIELRRNTPAPLHNTTGPCARMHWDPEKGKADNTRQHPYFIAILGIIIPHSALKCWQRTASGPGANVRQRSRRPPAQGGVKPTIERWGGCSRTRHVRWERARPVIQHPTPRVVNAHELSPALHCYKSTEAESDH